MSFVVQHPVRYPLRQPPTVVLSSRPVGDPPVQAASSSHFSQPHTDEPRTSRAATMLSRVIQQAHGYLPPGHRGVVAGTLTQHHLIKEWDTRYAQISKHLQTERYGERSFIYTWVDGEAAHENYAVLITNLDLEARAIELFVPANASKQGRQVHLAPAKALRADIRTIQDRIRHEYANAYDEAAELATSKASAGKRHRAEQLKRMYKELKDIVVLSRIPEDATFATPNEVRAAKLQPVFSRDARTRFKFWNKLLTADVVASHIGRGCAIVDVRSMLADPRFIAMINWVLPQVCDVLHQHVIYPKNLEIRLKSAISDAAVRGTYSIARTRNEVYAKIRALDRTYRSLQSDVPVWGDVPVFETLQYGHGVPEDDGKTEVSVAADIAVKPPTPDIVLFPS